MLNLLFCQWIFQYKSIANVNQVINKIQLLFACRRMEAEITFKEEKEKAETLFKNIIDYTHVKFSQLCFQ